MTDHNPCVIVLRQAVSDASPSVRQRLQDSCDITTTTSFDLTVPELADALQEATGVLVTGKVTVDAHLLGRAPKLRVVSVRAVGYDRVDVEACHARGIEVCYTPGVLDGAVADLTIALMLSVARRLPENFAAVAGEWHAKGTRPPLGHDVRGKTLGLLGMGRIGQVVARTASRGFGMTVLYHNRSPLPPEVERDTGATYVDRQRLFEESDYLSVHTPLTPETHHSVSHDELARMKPSAVLLNTARGDVVDEEALVAALRGQQIAGAGLDVMSEEPYPASGPLASLPNVVMTPHIGSATEETRQAMSDLSVENLLTALGGGQPPAVVPRRREASVPAGPA